jgi:hypothetical protein
MRWRSTIPAPDAPECPAGFAPDHDRAGRGVRPPSSTTHEVQNLAKCLAAGHNHALLISADEDCLTEARSLLHDAPSGRAHCLTPDRFIDFLGGLDAGDRPTAAPTSWEASTGQTGTGKRMLIAEDAAAYLGLAPLWRLTAVLQGGTASAL